MLRTSITTTDITNLEPALADYYRTGQTDYATQILNAKQHMEVDLKNRGRELRKLCPVLSLTDATKSDEDEVERTRLDIIITAVTGTATFAFQGTNDDSSETWTTISTNDSLSYTTTGTKTTTFSDTYKYYKLTKTGTVTYTARLVERSFELPHKFLTIALIFKSLQALVSDMWEQKAEYYMDEYNKAMDRALFSYDDDLDGDADSDELEISRVRFTR